jgi:hypothetical protein
MPFKIKELKQKKRTTKQFKSCDLLDCKTVIDCGKGNGHVKHLWID